MGGRPTCGWQLYIFSLSLSRWWCRVHGRFRKRTWSSFAWICRVWWLRAALGCSAAMSRGLTSIRSTTVSSLWPPSGSATTLRCSGPRTQAEDPNTSCSALSSFFSDWPSSVPPWTCLFCASWRWTLTTNARTSCKRLRCRGLRSRWTATSSRRRWRHHIEDGVITSKMGSPTVAASLRLHSQHGVGPPPTSVEFVDDRVSICSCTCYDFRSDLYESK